MCRRLSEQLNAAGIRAEADIRNEKINYKVREHSVGKVPVILAVGQREVEDGTVTLRRLGEKATQTLQLEQVIADLSGRVVCRRICGSRLTVKVTDALK